MRCALLLCALLTVAGCKREASFDDRYATVANQIDNRAAQIDAQLNAQAPPKP